MKQYLKDAIICINHGVNTRKNANNNELQIPVRKLKTGQKTFKYRASMLWNKLDKKVKTLQILTHLSINK